MTSAAETVTTSMDPAEWRYRAAEESLWSANGLQPTERWVEVDDPKVRIRVVEVGSGAPVLFIPGTGGTGPWWAPLVRELTGFRCLMMDRPGRGLSSPIDFRSAEYRSLVVSILEGVLDAMALDRVDIVGSSIGGLWGLRLARSRPSRVGKLVLIGGMPHPEVELPKFIKLLRSPLGAVLVRIPMKQGMLDKQLRALGHGPTLDAGGMQDFITWRLAFVRDTRSLHHERDMVRAITKADGFQPGVLFEDAELRQIRQPIFMSFGTADPTGSADIWTRFVASMPNGEVQLIESAGHQPWWDRPSEVGSAVGRFLRS